MAEDPTEEAARIARLRDIMERFEGQIIFPESHARAVCMFDKNAVYADVLAKIKADNAVARAAYEAKKKKENE